jgi:hypothetical protein
MALISVAIFCAPMVKFHRVTVPLRRLLGSSVVVPSKKEQK